MVEESDLLTRVSHDAQKFTGTLNIGLKPDGSGEGRRKKKVACEGGGIWTVKVAASLD